MKKKIWGTKVTDPLYRKSGKQFYVCEHCNKIYTYLGIDRHRQSCKVR